METEATTCQHLHRDDYPQTLRLPEDADGADGSGQVS